MFTNPCPAFRTTGPRPNACNLFPPTPVKWPILSARTAGWPRDKACCSRWNKMATSQSPPFHRGLTSRKLKNGVFALEGLNALATTYFFYDIYFYTRDQFKFGALQNLLLAALLGVVYAVSAYYGGRFAQKFGYLTAVRWGTGLMTAIFLVGSQVK